MNFLDLVSVSKMLRAEERSSTAAAYIAAAWLSNDLETVVPIVLAWKMRFRQ